MSVPQNRSHLRSSEIYIYTFIFESKITAVYIQTAVNLLSLSGLFSAGDEFTFGALAGRRVCGIDSE